MNTWWSHPRRKFLTACYMAYEAAGLPCDMTYSGDKDGIPNFRYPRQKLQPLTTMPRKCPIVPAP